MNDLSTTLVTRRQSLAAAFAAGISLCGVGTASGRDPSLSASLTRGTPAYPFRLGLASYTLRKFDLDHVIPMTLRVGLKSICLKSFHLPLDATPEQIKSAADKIRAAGLDLYCAGVITMKSEADVIQAFEYASLAQLPMINVAPTPKMLAAIEKQVKSRGISVAIHNHGPGDLNFPTPASVLEKISKLDRRIGLCIDVGHTVRIGANVVDSIRAAADRLFDLHFKDVTEAAPSGKDTEIGRGVIDIPTILKTLKEVNYHGVVAFEYESQPDDPLPGLAESVGYVRGMLAAS